MKKKGTRRCLHQDTKSLITPSLHLCFALTCCLFVCYECIRQSKQHNILTSNCLHENVNGGSLGPSTVITIALPLPFPLIVHFHRLFLLRCSYFPFRRHTRRSIVPFSYWCAPLKFHVCARTVRYSESCCKFTHINKTCMIWGEISVKITHTNVR